MLDTVGLNILLCLLYELWEVRNRDTSRYSSVTPSHENGEAVYQTSVSHPLASPPAYARLVKRASFRSFHMRSPSSCVFARLNFEPPCFLTISCTISAASSIEAGVAPCNLKNR